MAVGARAKMAAKVYKTAPSATGKRVAAAKKKPVPNASARARARANTNARFKRTASPAAKAHARKKIAKRVYGH